MAYLVTGATGFIGRRLVKKLVETRKGKIYVLVRDPAKLEAHYAYWGVGRDRVIALTADLGQPGLGLEPAELEPLKGGKIKHLFHLAAIYDIKASAEEQIRVNIEGTRQMVALAETLKVGCLHHISSIAAAGLYEGVFREDMFEEAEGLDHPYFRTKHDAEGIVRRECKRPWRVYRPAFVVGDSRTGEMDKIDGPYYFFKLIQKMRDALPQWMPTVGLEGGRINMVPVDFVVDALDYLAHLKDQDGKTFHLVDPDPHRIGDALNLFAKAAHAPQMAMRVNARLFDFIPPVVRMGLSMLPPVRRISRQILQDLGVPEEVLRFINWPTRYDCRETLKALEGSGIRVPPLQSYAWRLWDYWERHLDPDLFIDRSLAGHVGGRVVVVTGASSGIGKATALKLAEAGAKVILVARDMEKLQQTLTEIEVLGGTAHFYSADLSDMEACDRLVQQVLAEHGAVDVLVNNAGRSIRRAIEHSFDRFHDFERCMKLNYFGSLRLTLGLLPAMMARRNGHIINISSIGVLSNAPRFSAYVASKAALDAFTRCAASEFADKGISFTTINMPLVRTPMIAPTKIYQNLPTLSPEEAADLVVEAIIYKPTRIATRMGIFAQIMHAVAPKVTQVILNTAFRMFPDSAAARGLAEEAAQPSPEQIAFAQLTRGIHW
ncbi:MAG TPA: SDR family oxidoreductase [Candidatus Competibacteraceae bacterium]|nr:SDR family oxidoreductase [Candidatus Competibacteraceae bacterium]